MSTANSSDTMLMIKLYQTTEFIFPNAFLRRYHPFFGYMAIKFRTARSAPVQINMSFLFLLLLRNLSLKKKGSSCPSNLCFLVRPILVW